MPAASSTSQSNETVTLKLPTGEMVDAIVPGGLDDDGVKSYVQAKRPDLFGAPNSSGIGGMASMPGAPSQQNVNYANPLPTENIPIAGAMAQPFGEVAAGLKYDPQFRNETGKNAAIAAGAAGSALAAPAIGAAASSPVLTKVLANLAQEAPKRVAQGAGMAAGYGAIQQLIKRLTK